MAMRIKFPLKMPDGTEARTIEDLREHFDLATVLSYYSNGRLVKWLEDRYYDDEAKRVAELSPSSEELGKQICDILGVECPADASVDVGAIFKKNDKREQMKKFTSDDKILENADKAAFTQEDIDALIKDGAKEIYLCGEHFTLPTNVPEITYIGVNMPTVEFEGASFEKGIQIKGIKPDIEKYLDKNCELWDDDEESLDNFIEFFNSELKSDLKIMEIASPKAQYVIGICYDNCDSTEEDKQEAVKWMRKAAEQGHLSAQTELGECYYNGDGVEQDYEEAVKWYRKAAEQGHLSAQTELGECYYDGYGVQQDYEEAVKWYHKAAEKGDAAAQCLLGECYYNGNGVEQNYQEAVKWYRKAAEQGTAWAQCELGNCYYNGVSVEQDYQEAVKWFRFAAEQGYPPALNVLGDCYYNGNGVQQDNKEAEKWYRLAAERGDSQAQCNLALRYYFGNGVKRDKQEAEKWFRMAAAQGNGQAKIYLDDFYDHNNDDALVRFAAEKGNIFAKMALKIKNYIE